MFSLGASSDASCFESGNFCIIEKCAQKHGDFASNICIDITRPSISPPTLADAILDRLVHNAYQINLKGESMRKRLKNLTQTSHYDKKIMSGVATLRQVAGFDWVRWPKSLDYTKWLIL